MSNRIIYNLFKQAVDILEERQAPEWITQHPKIKKLKQVEKAFESYGITSFRDKVELEGGLEAENKKLIERASDGIYYATFKILLEVRILSGQMEQLADFHKFLEDLTLALSGNDTLPFQSDVKSGKFSVRKGQPITRVYSYACRMVDEFNRSLGTSITYEKLDDIKEVQELNNKSLSSKKEYFVVFNSGNEGTWDVCTMSERGITSCQRWGGATDDASQYNRGLIGSILSRNIGVLYLTAGDKTKSGERMLKRSLIKIVLDPKTLQPKILIDRMYDEYSENFMELFKTSLRKRSTIPVVSYRELGEEEIMQEIDPRVNELGKKEKPYQDTAMKRHFSEKPWREVFSDALKKARYDTNVELDRFVEFDPAYADYDDLFAGMQRALPNISESLLNKFYDEEYLNKEEKELFKRRMAYEIGLEMDVIVRRTINNSKLSSAADGTRELSGQTIADFGYRMDETFNRYINKYLFN